VDTARAIAAGAPPGGFTAGTNTTLCVVAVDCALSRLELQAVARSAGSGLLARITPAGTMADGDVVFALAPMEGAAGSAAQAEQLARQALERAIERAVS
jgi:L-aminopeptidase/D-esterase-like protein